MINIINGKEIQRNLLDECKKEILKYSNKRKPNLVVITIGEDKASKIYVKNKAKACEECGIELKNINFRNDVSKEEVISKINVLNNDKNVDGIMIQLPIPESLNGIQYEIDIKKDVDGLNPYNLENTLYNYEYSFKISPCTSYGIIYMLKKFNIDLKGKHIVIMGRSNLVGKPLIGMLLKENATVTSCNSYTNNLKEITKTADILICAVGKSKLIDRSYISEKTKAIIDVGINVDENEKVCGDVNFNDILNYWEDTNAEKYITPVPGGIGPVTVASLIHNVLECYKNNIKDSVK